MTENHAQYTSDYLLSAKSVQHAGEYLRAMVEEGEAEDIDFATEMLLQAYKRYDGSAEDYSRFMFDELAGTPPTEKASRERIDGDVLASVLTDLQVANVLLAAGEVMGETGAKADPSVLEESLTSLEVTTKVLEKPLRSPLGKPVQPQRFMFEGVTPAAPVAVTSPDIASPEEGFKNGSAKALDALVAEAKGALMPAIDGLTKLKSADLLQALSNLGKSLQKLPTVGRFFRWAVELVAKAIAKMTSLLGHENIGEAQKKVGQVIEKVKKGQLVDESLRWAFGVGQTNAQIEQLLQSTQAGKEAIDAGAKDVGEVASKFGEKAALVKRMVNIVAPVSGILTLAVPQASLYVAVAYVAFVGYVVLTGLDYADSGKIINRVSGIGEIAQRVLA